MAICDVSDGEASRLHFNSERCGLACDCVMWKLWTRAPTAKKHGKQKKI